jgi:hypothetical protein
MEPSLRRYLSRGVVAAALAVALASPAAPAQRPGKGYRSITITTYPITEFGHGGGARFDSLEFRGGLVVHSNDPYFGGLSGLDVTEDGRSIVAVEDIGSWFTARLVENAGKLVGIEDARLAPILDATGKPTVGKVKGDAEGLRLISDGGLTTALVSFEQVNNVRRFVANPDLANATPETVKLPASVTGMQPNTGLEAIAIAPAGSPLRGAIVLIAERLLDKNGRNRAWIVGGPLAGTFGIVRLGDYDFTDADFLPNGDLLILERRFNFSEGAGMRIRRIPGAEIRPGSVVTGETLIEAGMAYEIDNMEGLAITRDEAGETLLLVISDDNQSVLQRTLLLQFALVGK